MTDAKKLNKQKQLYWEKNIEAIRPTMLGAENLHSAIQELLQLYKW